MEVSREAKIVKLKLDIIFKRIFGDEKNEDIIAAFISSLLEIPRESIGKISIENVELTPEQLGQKFSRLDLKMDIDGRTVNIELQIQNEDDFNDRTLFYWARLYSESLKESEPYSKLKRTICINIINFNHFTCPDYHSQFKVLETERYEVLTDKFSIHFFELKKIKSAAKNKPMEDWLNLINAETEGDLMDIQKSTTIPEVQKTIVLLKNLSADEKIRQEAFYREKALHDEASAIEGAKQAGAIGERERLIRNWRAKGISEEEIRERLADI